MNTQNKTAADYQNAFDYYPQRNVWFTAFREQMAFVSCSTDIDIKQMTFEEALTEKPVYLAVMAKRKQLQPILDNPQLFDPAFVNAVRLLFLEHDNIKIEG